MAPSLERPVASIRLPPRHREELVLSAPLRTLIAAIVLVLIGSACETTVRVSTRLDTDGSGTFALTMSLDREARTGLESQDLLGRIDRLFERLRRTGWAVSRTEPDGGLVLEAARPFADEADFGRVLAELGDAQRRGEEPGGVSAVRFTLDVGTEDSLLRTRSRFGGEFDTSALFAGQEPKLREIVEQVLRFEIHAELPGTVSLTEGEATLREGVVVWRPRLGVPERFAATSSSLKLGVLIALLVPALLVHAAAWFLAGRRRRRVEQPRSIFDEPVQPAPAGERGN